MTAAPLSEKRRLLREQILRREGLAAPQGPRRIPRRAGTGPAPLSFGQQRLWFLHQLDPGSAAYNMSEAVRLTGRLDEAALEQALAGVVRRHEVLRTTFPSVDGEPVQAIAIASPFVPPLPRIDLSGLPPAVGATTAAGLAGELAGQPFDLERGPVLRTVLLRLAATDHILFLSLHHIVADGWSMGILLREITALYAAAAAGRSPALAELSLQFPDFAVWQRQELQREVLESHLRWWKERLEGAPTRLELPTDHPRRAFQSPEGAFEPLHLDADLTRILRELADRRGATLYMAVVAGLGILLQRYTGQGDLLVGTAAAGRQRSELEGLIGFFVNTLVLRLDLSGDPNAHGLLHRMREVMLASDAHQDLPFEELVHALEPSRNLSQHPLFSVMLSFQNLPPAAAALPAEVSLEGFRFRRQTVQFDLHFDLTDGPQGLGGTLGYRTALFESATARRLARSFEAVLAGMARQPGRPVSELPLLTDAESLELATAWNRPAASAASRIDTTLDRLFAATVEHSPRALALSCAGQILTYRDLDERSNRLARWLRRLGIGPESRVGLRVERSPEMVVGILGILKAGGAYVPLDPDVPAERLAFLLADSEVKLLLTEAELSSPEVAAEDATPLAPSARPDNAAYVIYTSGSTGRPKGVVVTHANVARLLAATEPWFGFSPDDVWTLFHSYAFDFSVWEIWGALAYGGRLVVVPWEVSRSPEAFLDLLARERVTVLNQTPSAFRLLSHAEESGVPRELCPRQVIFGGEALELPSLAPWIARHGDERPRLVNMYGITETTVHVTFRRIAREDVEAGRGSVIGEPIPDLQVHVLDRHLQPVPFLAPGEICVGGAGLARGYLGRPELTADRFVPDPYGALFGRTGARLYRSGDLARRRPDGDLEYLGRRDQQVKIRGFRIELREIEAQLAALAGVREAVVLAREDRPDPSGPADRRLVAYVVGDVAAGTLRQALRERLPEHMVPAAFVTLAALPLTPNGKVDRKALPAPEWQGAEEGYRAPQTPVEEVLAGIWAELLKLDRVGAADHFFDLGGHSLLATQVMSRLRSIFGVELPLRTLFEAPMLADLAARVAEALRDGGGHLAPPLVPVPREGALPLSFAQQRLWFIDQLQPGTPLYNIPVALRVEGPLDSAILALCLGEIVRRHEALRTVFTAPEGSPVQVIRTPAPLGLPVVDLSELPESRRETLASDLAGEEAGRGFDLTRGLLLRGVLLRLGKEDHVIALTLHHIASDGWSMGLLVREVTALYTAFVEGRPSPLPELPVQYADFAVWQRSWLQGEILEREISFWRRQLAGLPPRLELLTDRSRPAVQSFRGASRPVRLPAGLVRQAQALGRRKGATLFMVLLAGFQALLARYSGQKDLAVGTPISGRNRTEIEELIGFFVNTLVLRGNLTGDPSFGELLGRVRETALAAHTHQDVPFEKLVQELAPERSLAQTPLFQVMFALQNASAESLEMRSLRLQPVSGPVATAKFDLTLNLAEWNGELGGSVVHATDLFDAATIDRLIVHYEELLAGAFESPATPLSELSLLTDAERSQVAVEWNDTARALADPPCLHHLIALQAARAPEAEAVVCEGRSLTFGALGRRAAGLARRLRELGVGPEVPVALFLDRSVEAVVAVVGVLAAGGAYVPLDPAYPAERIAWVLEDTRTPVVVTASDLAGRLPGGTRTLLVEEVEESAETFDGGAGPDNPAYVIYTSGSTGRPKGVVVRHASVLSFAHALRETVYRGETGPLRVALNASLSFDASVQQIVQLAWGDPLHVLPQSVRLDPAALVDRVRRHRLDVLDCTPSQLRLLLQAGLGEGDAAPAMVLVGGEAVDSDLRDAALARTRTRFWNVYGPTECTVDTTAAPFTADGPASRIGLPLPNVRVHVVAGLGGLASLNMPGELQVGGADLARGYLGRPDLTAERFVPDPFGEAGGRLYRTGDLVRWLPDGSLDYLGRLDHQIKLRGFRIDLGEIEALLRSAPGIQEAVVLLRESSGRGLELVACVEPAGGATPEPDELRRFLAEKLPDYMLPSAYVSLERLPVNPSGKLDRRALEQWAASVQTSSDVAYRQPRDPVELKLARIWEELLSVDRVGLDDDFFHLGGHSLLAVSLISRIEQRLGLRLPTAALFQGATLERLARVLRENADRTGSTRSTSPSLLVPLRIQGDAPPWFFVHPVGGQVHWYLELARSLPEGVPAFGLQAPGLEDPELILDDLPTMAETYLSAVRAVQPQGPYFLAGWSAGGVIAFEMARTLRAQGQTVGAIVLIDSLVHAGPRAEAGEDEVSLWIDMISHLTSGAIDHGAWREALLARDRDQRLSYVAAELTGRGLLPPGLGAEHLQRILGVYLATLKGVRLYEPAPCPGTGALVWATATAQRHDDASLDWASLFEGGCEVHDVPGNHYSMLTKQVGPLASLLAGLNASKGEKPMGRAMQPLQRLTNGRTEPGLQRSRGPR